VENPSEELPIRRSTETKEARGIPIPKKLQIKGFLHERPFLDCKRFEEEGSSYLY
jgi:hypothetical protein